MKAIHNIRTLEGKERGVVLYPKDTEKWKQFTTDLPNILERTKLFCIPKILKNESNSQLNWLLEEYQFSCFVSQRYWKMKAIHNQSNIESYNASVVLYPKDTEKWKQFTTCNSRWKINAMLFCIPKILKNESNSQLNSDYPDLTWGCFVSQRYWKMKAIHNTLRVVALRLRVVLYPKDTEKWKQFTTEIAWNTNLFWLFCIPKILKNESNSQPKEIGLNNLHGCFVSQRYWKMKAIHNV